MGVFVILMFRFFVSKYMIFGIWGGVIYYEDNYFFFFLIEMLDCLIVWEVRRKKNLG
jgi:hypothetical protein